MCLFPDSESVSLGEYLCIGLTDKKLTHIHTHTHAKSCDSRMYACHEQNLDGDHQLGEVDSMVQLKIRETRTVFLRLGK